MIELTPALEEALQGEPTTYPPGSTAADIEAAYNSLSGAEETKENSHSDDNTNEFSIDESGAPKHWSNEDKAIFTALDSQTKEWLLNRHKSMEGDYTRKTQDLSSQRRKYDSLETLLQPLREDLEGLGLDEITGIQHLIAVYQQLKTNPEQTLQNLQRAYGLESKNTALSPPELQRLEAELHQMKQQFGSQLTHSRYLGVLQGQQEIRRFVSEKDASGAAKYPHFQAVLPEMVALARMDLQMGKRPNLQNLYERASWSSEAARPHYLADQQKATIKELEQAAKAKALAARNAGASINGAPQGQGASKPRERTLREELEHAFSQGYRI
ncbi:MAG: hypothetical protein AB7U41_06085 [Dongiaceae bacterium]